MAKNQNTQPKISTLLYYDSPLPDKPAVILPANAAIRSQAAYSQVEHSLCQQTLAANFATA
jgi:hypothetical protein